MCYKNIFLLATTGLLISNIAMGEKIYDNQFRDFTGNLREARTIKAMDFSDSKIYIINSQASFNGTDFDESHQETLFELDKNATNPASDLWSANSVTYLSKSSKSKVNSISATTVQSNEIIIVGTTDDEIRQFDGTDWLDANASEENLPNTFSANVLTKYTKTSLPYSLLGVSGTEDDTNNKPKGTLYELEMNSLSQEAWDPKYMLTTYEFNLPVVDIIVSEHNSNLIYVAVNTGLSDVQITGNTMIDFYDSAQVTALGMSTTDRVNGIWWSRDGGSSFEKMNLSYNEQFNLTGLGYVELPSSEEVIVGIYNTPNSSPIDPRNPYRCSDNGLLLQRIEENGIFSALDGSTTKVDMNDGSPTSTSFINDLEILQHFDGNVGDVKMIVADYGNGLFDLMHTHSLLANSGNAPAQPTSISHNRNLRENPEFGAYVIKRDNVGVGDERIYLGGYASFNKLNDPDGTNKEWTSYTGGLYEPTDEVIHVSVIYNSDAFPPYSALAGVESRGIAVTKRGVFINVHPSESLADQDWRLYFSPGGEIVTAHTDRFSGIEWLTLTPSTTDEFKGDGLALACFHEEFTDTQSGAKRYTIYSIAQQYPTIADPSNSIMGESTPDITRTNYFDKKRPVNDIIVKPYNNNIIVAGIGACPSGSCDDDLRFIIAGPPDNLEGISKYQSESYSTFNTNVLSPSSTEGNIKKIAMWLEPFSLPFDEDDFFSDGKHGIFGIAENGDIFEILLDIGSKLIYKKTSTQMLGSSPTLNDITLATPGYFIGITPYTVSLLISTDAGIFISDRLSNSILNNSTTFTNITSSNNPLNGEFTNYLDFSNRPLASITEEEVMCIVDNGDGTRGVIYTNNLVEYDTQGQVITPVARENIDWIEVSEDNIFEASNKKFNCLWISEDVTPPLIGLIDKEYDGDNAFLVGDYEQRVFAGLIATDSNDELVYKTNNVFNVRFDITNVAEVILASTGMFFRGVHWFDIGEIATVKLDFSGARTYFFSRNKYTFTLSATDLFSHNSLFSSTRQNAPPRTGDSDTGDDWGGIVLWYDETKSTPFSSGIEVIFTGSNQMYNCEYGLTYRSLVGISPAVPASFNYNPTEIDLNGIEFSNNMLGAVKLEERYEIVDAGKFKVRNCTFNGWDDPSASTSRNEIYLKGINFGYTPSGTPQNLIENNDFNAENEYGIKFEDGTSDFVITGNEFYDNTVSAIDIEEANYPIEISSNKIEGTLSSGYTVHGINLKDNDATITISNHKDSNGFLNTQYGVRIERGSSVLIDDNYFGASNENSIAAIYIYNAQEAFTDANIEITRNDIYSYSTAIKCYGVANHLLKVGNSADWTKANEFYENLYGFHFERNFSSFTSLIKRNTSATQLECIIYRGELDASLVDASEGQNSFDPLNNTTPPAIGWSKAKRVENYSASTTYPSVLASVNYWGIPECDPPSSPTCNFTTDQFIGNVDYSSPLWSKPTSLPKEIASESENVIPNVFKLKQNYPNPFNPTTTIEYWIPEMENHLVSLKIFNLLGQEVKTLVNETQMSGIYSVDWNGTNNFGKKVSSGIYFYKINAGSYSEVKKLLLLK
ncbi:MAG: T9SS C-terminal target domain-containing protein [Calditrichaeota bacterium]|nr:MAG: T9SS C-terminal target domain-containing protein [Calditrichota bacterium]